MKNKETVRRLYTVGIKQDRFLLNESVRRFGKGNKKSHILQEILTKEMEKKQ